MRALVLLLLLLDVRALAQAHPLVDALVVPAEAVCLTRDALLEHTQAWLGRDLDVRISIVVDLGSDERLDVAFALLDGQRVVARRTFPRLPEACPDRRAAFSLALAIALDASVLDRLAGVTTEVSEPEVLPPSEPVTSPSSPATPRSSRSTHIDVAVDVAVGAGALPTWSWLGGAELALRGDLWQVRIAGRISTRERVAIGAGRVRTQLGVGDLSACMHVESTLRVRACVGPVVGRLMAHGVGFDQTRNATLWWGAVGAELSARWPLAAPVAIRFGIRGHVKWLRPTLVVVDEAGRSVAQISSSIGGVAGFVGLVATLR